jgi:putative aldouronate transport system substrate-binding protein
MTKPEYTMQIRTVDPGARWVQLAAPRGSHGRGYGGRELGGSRHYRVVSAGLAGDPERLDRVLRLVDYCATDEGMNLVSYGIEGVHWRYRDGQVTATERLFREGGYFWVYQFSDRREREYLMTKFVPQREMILFADSEPRVETVSDFADSPSGFDAAATRRFVDENLMLFAYGKRPLEDYERFLRELRDVYRYDLWLEEAEGGLEALGLLPQRFAGGR